MKHFIVFVLALILSACASSKKASTLEKTESSVDSVVVSENLVKNTFFDIDTSKVKEWGFTITEIEYFPPDSDANAMQMQCKCNAKAFNNKSPSGVTGSIKKWKQTTFGSKFEQKGKTEQAEFSDSEKQAMQNRRNDMTINKEQTRTNICVNWFVVSAVFAAILLLYLKRVPILNAIRKILSSIRRIL